MPILTLAYTLEDGGHIPPVSETCSLKQILHSRHHNYSHLQQSQTGSVVYLACHLSTQVVVTDGGSYRLQKRFTDIDCEIRGQFDRLAFVYSVNPKTERNVDHINMQWIEAQMPISSINPFLRL